MIEMTRDWLKTDIKDIKSAQIKFHTYDDMYYTYAIIDEETDVIIDFKEIEDTPKKTLGEKIYESISDSLIRLEYVLENNTFIYCWREQKILNCKEIKETIVNYIYK